MSMFKAAEFKVGALVLAVGSLIAFMSMQVSDDPSYLGRAKKAWFMLPNAGGLIKNSAVKSAGIPVGVIKDIRLQDGMARIEITVKSDINLTKTATIEIKSQGILGDKYVEVNPGSPTDPVLADGSQILNVKDKGSLDSAVGQIGDIAASLKDVAVSLREAVTEDGTRKHILGRIISNIETITSDLSHVTSENKDKISDILSDVRNVTAKLDEVVNDPGQDGLKQAWGRLSKVTKNLDDITTRINNGEGTIGKLINDETTVDQINTTIEGVSNMLDSASRITTGFDYHAEYLGAVGSAKSYIGVKIQPGLDRYYYLAIIDDPAGVVETTDTVVTDNLGSSNGDVTTKKTYYNKTKLTLMYAKNFWDWTLRAGLIENNGGFGVDYNFFRRKMRLSFEAYEFSKLNLRTILTYQMKYGFYVNGGMSDMLNKSDRQSAFVGAGLYLTNDDLKLLLTKSPF